MSLATRAAWVDSARFTDDCLLRLAIIITVETARTTTESTISVIIISISEKPRTENRAWAGGTERIEWGFMAISSRRSYRSRSVCRGRSN